MQAEAIESIEVLESAFYQGVGYLKVPCSGYEEFKQLPAAVRFEGKVYGKSGWNSDIDVAYYRTDKPFATIAKVAARKQGEKTMPKHPKFIRVRGQLYRLADTHEAATDIGVAGVLAGLMSAKEKFSKAQTPQETQEAKEELAQMAQNLIEVLK